MLELIPIDNKPVWIDIDTYPLNLNPISCQDYVGFTILQATVETLFVRDKTGHWTLGAADSVQVSEANTSYRFRLPIDRLWSNGDPIIAADFVRAFQRILDPNQWVPFAPWLYCIRNAQGYHSGCCEWEDVGG